MGMSSVHFLGFLSFPISSSRVSCGRGAMSAPSSSPRVQTIPLACFHVTPVAPFEHEPSFLFSGGVGSSLPSGHKEGFLLGLHHFHYPSKSVVGQLSFEEVKPANPVCVLE